jgi:uncharacterized protein YhfF
MTYLPEGCARPAYDSLEAFWAAANQAVVVAASGYQVRWIGLDHASTEEVLGLIASGDKTGTFTLPWIVAATGEPEPAVGDAIILIDFAGHPRQLVELTNIVEVAFGAITTEHTAVDGSPVRDLAIWKPLHTQYWNALLAPFGMAVSDEMPVLVESFRVLYP